MSKTLIFLNFISSASSCMLKKWAQDLYCDVLLSLSMITVVSCFMSISANFSLIELERTRMNCDSWVTPVRWQWLKFHRYLEIFWKVNIHQQYAKVLSKTCYGVSVMPNLVPVYDFA